MARHRPWAEAILWALALVACGKAPAVTPRPPLEPTPVAQAVEPSPTQTGSFTPAPTRRAAPAPTITATATAERATAFDRPAGVAFISATQGWALAGAGDDPGEGRAVLATSDGGRTWALQYEAEAALHNLLFLDEQHGWALASDCSDPNGPWRTQVLATGDGGRTWRQQGQSDALLHDLQFIDALHGWALADVCPQGKQQPCRRELRSTADGGATWQQVAVGELDPLSFSFVDAEHGWVTGCAEQGSCQAGQVWATADGGRTWEQLSTSTPFPIGTAITFINRDEGWLLTEVPNSCTMGGCWGPLYHTADGGRHWLLLQPLHRWQMSGRWGDSGWPGRPHFVSPTTGWIPIIHGAGSGVGGLALTTDGGRTWLRMGASEGWEIGGVVAPSAQEVWIVGTRWESASPLAFLAHSDDGGHTWTQQLPAPRPVAALSFVNRERGWGIGTAMDPGAVLATTDGGRNWAVLATFAAMQFDAVQFVDAQRGWLAGGDHSGDLPAPVLLGTGDGGHTWQVLYRPPEPAMGLWFSSAQQGLLAICPVGAAVTADLLASRDGGRTWTQKARLAVAEQIVAIHFLDGHRGWMVTYVRSGNHVWATEDGGLSWALASTVDQLPTFPGGLCFVSPQVGWLAFERTLLVTADGGRTWTEWPLPEGIWAGYLTFADEHAGWLIAQGQVWHSTDGGETWSPLP